MHQLWRTFFRDDSENKNESRIIEFCQKFISAYDKMERFYKGFLYAMAQNIALKNEQKTPNSIQKLELKHSYFLECLSKGKLL